MSKGVQVVFFRKKIQTRASPWTKNLLVEQFSRELVGIDYQVKNSRIQFLDGKLFLVFISSNFSSNDDIELNASLFFENDENFIVHLFEYAQHFYGNKYRALTIGKRESWERSAFQAECREIFSPTLYAIINNGTRDKFLRGESVVIDGKKFSLPGDDVDLWGKDLLTLMSNS